MRVGVPGEHGLMPTHHLGLTMHLSRTPQSPTGAYDSAAEEGECVFNTTDGGCITKDNECGCWIGGTCYAPDASNRDNQCYKCDRSKSTSKWTARVVDHICEACVSVATHHNRKHFASTVPSHLERFYSVQCR